MNDRAASEAQIAALRRGAALLETEDELRDRLREGRPLRIKFGADPSAPDIHLGHTVVLNRLRLFQEMGHEVIFIIGDFTARIGDPSGRSRTRPQLSREEVERNAETYKGQVFKILDEARTTVLFNSRWLHPLAFEDVIRLASGVTVAQMLQRDDYAKRYGGGVPISLHEFLYPLAQGYDSVHTRADVEIGGTDQTFNLLLGRELQRFYGQRPQVIMTMPLLEGLDGIEKMSKTLGNYVGVTEPPYQIFGKIMSIPDSLMPKYYELLTDLDYARLQREIPHPRDLKMRLAGEMVRRYHGDAAAASARRNFETTYSRKGVPEDEAWVKTVARPPGKYELARLIRESGLARSFSEARRLIAQGAVRIDDLKLADEKASLELKAGDASRILRVGKKGFAKIETRR